MRECPLWRYSVILFSICIDIGQHTILLSFKYTWLLLTKTSRSYQFIKHFTRAITHFGKIQTFYTKYRPNKDPIYSKGLYYRPRSLNKDPTGCTAIHKGIALPRQRSLRTLKTLYITLAFIVCFQNLQIRYICLRDFFMLFFRDFLNKSLRDFFNHGLRDFLNESVEVF